MKPARVLLVGDIHLRDTPPVHCTQTYTEDLLAMLHWLADYSKKQDFDAVIWAGDVFDHKAPSKTSHALVMRLLEVVREHEGKLWIVPGNHDQLHDRLASVHVTQPLGVLLAAGAHELNGWHETLPVYGVPWLQDWAHLEAEFDGWRKAGRSDCLAVMHAPIFPPELVESVPYWNLPAAEVARCMGNAGSLYYGHIHDYHGTFRVDGVEFCNVGALSRGSLTESNLSRPVRAAVWEQGAGFTELDIPHRPAAEVFRVAEAEAIKAASLDLESFLAAVGSNRLELVSVVTTARIIRDMESVPEDVKDAAIELLEWADSAD